MNRWKRKLITAIPERHRYVNPNKTDLKTVSKEIFVLFATFARDIFLTWFRPYIVSLGNGPNLAKARYTFDFPTRSHNLYKPLTVSVLKAAYFI